MTASNHTSIAPTYVHPAKIVEVFKTNVCTRWQAQLLVLELKKIWPAARITFDLEDCDKILRIESPTDRIDTQQVVHIVCSAGCLAELLC